MNHNSDTKSFGGGGVKFEVTANPFGISAAPIKPPADAPMDPKLPNLPPMLVAITHDMFSPWFVLTFNDQTEELELAEALKWFEEHGARGEKAKSKCLEMLNRAWNFGAANIVIRQPIMPRSKRAESIDPVV